MDASNTGAQQAMEGNNNTSILRNENGVVAAASMLGVSVTGENRGVVAEDDLPLLDHLAASPLSHFQGYIPPTDIKEMGNFQNFYENQTMLQPNEKYAYLFMVASLGVVPGCTLESKPYITYIKNLRKKGKRMF